MFITHRQTVVRSYRNVASCFLLIGLALVVSGCSLGPRRPVASPMSGVAQAETIRIDIAEPLKSPTPQQQTVLDALKEARVIYLGETHDRAADHQAQLQIIRHLVEQGKSVAIAFEMFQRPFQPVLDQYAAGQIDADALRIQSEYDERWGFPWPLYSPILEYAQAQNLPMLAANTPREMTRKVARQGLESLSGSDLEFIPPVSEIDLSNEGYRAYVQAVFSGFHGHGGHGGGQNDGSPASSPPSEESKAAAFERFFSAQVLWDETMAQTVAEFAEANPETAIVVLAGQGHVIYEFGIPSRVERRLGEDLAQVTVLLNPSDGFRRAGEGAIADYFWDTP